MTTSRILHLIPTLEGGGAERQLTLLANAQARCGHDVHVGLIRTGIHRGAIEPAVSIHQRGSLSHHDPRLVPWAAGLLRRIRPDVVQTWLPMMDVVGGMAACALRTPWVLAERSSAAMYSPRWRDRVLRRGMGRFASAIVANSEAGLAYWRKPGDRAATRAVIRNSVQLGAIRDAPRAATWPAPDPGAPRVLFAGRLDPAKDVGTFVRAMMQLRRCTQFSALVLGEGPDGQAARDVVHAAGMDDKVGFGGYRDDFWGLLKAARVFVSTSRIEGQPNAVLEALACGTPVIVSDIPAHREFLDERSVRFAPPGDAAGFATAIAAALSDPDPAARTGAGYAVVEALQAETAVAAYDAVYRSIPRAR